MHCELQPRTKEHAGSRRLTQVHRRGLPLHRPSAGWRRCWITIRREVPQTQGVPSSPGGATSSIPNCLRHSARGGKPTSARRASTRVGSSTGCNCRRESASLYTTWLPWTCGKPFAHPYSIQHQGPVRGLRFTLVYTLSQCRQQTFLRLQIAVLNHQKDRRGCVRTHFAAARPPRRLADGEQLAEVLAIKGDLPFPQRLDLRRFMPKSILEGTGLVPMALITLQHVQQALLQPWSIACP